MTPFHPFAIVATAGLWTAALLMQPAKPATTPPAAPPPKAPDSAPKPEVKPTDSKAPAATEIKDADELLTALETADKRISTISADLVFTTVAGEIEGQDMQRRQGAIYFRNRSDAKATGHFVILCNGVDALSNETVMSCRPPSVYC